MNTLEKLQKLGSDRFAHLVTFRNTRGFNGRNIRIDLPSRFNNIQYMDKHPSIKFDEDMLTIKFQYTPSDKTFVYLSTLSMEAKKNKGIKSIFKRSGEKFKLQVFPKGYLDGCLMIWHGIKLKKVQSKFIDDNVLETELIFSFRKTEYTYLSKAMQSSNEQIEHSMKIFNEYIDDYIENLQKDNKEIRENDNLEGIPIELQVNNSTPSEITKILTEQNEEICETNKCKEGEDKSTE